VAKVSTRHFYQLHSNKEDMLLDLYASLTSASLEDVVESLQRTEGETLAGRIRDAVGAYLRPLLADPRKARIAFVEIVGVSARVEERRLQFRNGIVAMVESESKAAVARGEVTSDPDIRFRALALVGAANVIVHDWSIHRSRSGAAALEEAFCDLAVELVVGRTEVI
jgi:AcrR family transcriptional regulator